jgi:hypothetical protein
MILRMLQSFFTGFNNRKVQPRKPGARHKIKAEEKIDSPTPDKMDRTTRGKDPGTDGKPYPLTEEEAAPTTPKSEKKSTD